MKLVQILHRWASRAKQRGNLSRLAALRREVVRLEPAPKHRIALATVLEEVGRYGEAARVYNDLAKDKGPKAAQWQKQSTAALTLHRALARPRTAAERKKARSLEGRALRAERSRQFTTALKLLRRAQVADPDPSLWLAAARVLERQGQSVAARRARSRALALAEQLAGSRVKTDERPPINGTSRSIDVSPDGELYALTSGSHNQITTIWSRKPQRPLAILPGALLRPGFDRSSSRVATVLKDRVRIWDVRRQRVLRELRVKGVGSEWMDLNGTRLIARNGYDFEIWNWRRGSLLGRLKTSHYDPTPPDQGPLQGDPMNFSAISRDGRLLLTEGKDLLLWDLRKNGKLRATMKTRLPSPGYERPQGVVIFGPRGRLVGHVGSGHLKGRYQDEILLWKTGRTKPWRRVQHLIKRSRTYAISLDWQGRLYQATDEDELVVWNARRTRRIRTLKGAGSRVAFDRKGRFLVASGTMRPSVWDLKKWALVKPPGISLSSVTDVALVDQGRQLVVGGTGPVIQLWNTTLGRLEGAIRGPKKGVGLLAVSPDAKKLVALTGNSLWYGPLRPGALRQLPGKREWRVQAVAYGPRGKLLAAGTSEGEVHVIALPSGKTVHRLKGVLTDRTSKTDAADALQFSPDGSQLFIALRHGRIRQWQLASGKHHVVATVRKSGLVKIYVRPDGKIVCQWVDAMKNRKRAWLLPSKKKVAWEAEPKGRVLLRVVNNGVAVGFGIGTWGPNGRIARKVRYIKLAGMQLMMTQWTAPSLRVLTLPDLHHVYLVRPDGPLDAWIARIRPTMAGGWIANTRHGEWDASKGVNRLSVWTDGKRRYPWDLAWHAHHVPGLLGQVLAPKETPRQLWHRWLRTRKRRASVKPTSLRKGQQPPVTVLSRAAASPPSQKQILSRLRRLLPRLKACLTKKKLSEGTANVDFSVKTSGRIWKVLCDRLLRAKSCRCLRRHLQRWRGKPIPKPMRYHNVQISSSASW